MKNLLKKLFCVYVIFNPNDAEAEDEIRITRDPLNFLGHSTLVGVFLTKTEANQFAAKLQVKQFAEKKIR